MRLFRWRGASGPDPTAIWNRAVDDLPPDARPGDVALHDALELQGFALNGGLGHALDVVGRDGAERAAAGWEYLGRPDVAALLREALAVVPEMPDDVTARSQFFVDGWTVEQAQRIELLDERYDAPGSADPALETALEDHLRRRPEDFKPLQ